MKIIIAGGRDFINYDLLIDTCDEILKYFGKVEIVSGGAKGADALGKEYAKLRNYDFKEFSADWNKHGKSAGPIRNKQMAEYADMLISFWDGKSRGTNNMIKVAEKLGLIIKTIKY